VPFSAVARKKLLLVFATALLAFAGLTASAGAYNASSNYSFKKDNCKNISDPTTILFYGSYAKSRLIAGDLQKTRFPNRQGRNSVISGEFNLRTGWSRHSTDNFFKQPIQVFGRASGVTDCKENPANTDLASEFGFGHGRFHTRMWDLGGPGTPGVTATPHKEDWYWTNLAGKKCASQQYRGVDLGSHAVEQGAVDRGPQNYEKHGSGFDRGRRKVVEAFRREVPGITGHRIAYRQLGNTRSVRQCDGGYAGSNGQVGYIQLGF
jgi:hypothetical protein